MPHHLSCHLSSPLFCLLFSFLLFWQLPFDFWVYDWLSAHYFIARIMVGTSPSLRYLFSNVQLWIHYCKKKLWIHWPAANDTSSFLAINLHDNALSSSPHDQPVHVLDQPAPCLMVSLKLRSVRFDVPINTYSGLIFWITEETDPFNLLASVTDESV